MTGRGAGYCGGYATPGYANPMPRRGMAMGWGGGRGWAGGGGRGRRNWYYATGLPGWARYGAAPAWGAPPVGYGPMMAAPAPDQEIEFLRSQAEWLQQELEAISGRITELEDEA